MKFNNRIFLPLIIVLSAALALLRFNSLQIGTSYDDAKYVILAESLASGEGYQLINFPHPQAELNFPPGWPLLLAPFTILFPKNYDALKFVSLALWLASLFLVDRFFAKRLDSPYCQILTTLVALNPLLVGTSVTLMSETAYLFFSLAALTAWERSENKSLFWLALAAGLATYAQQIRAVGVALGLSLLIVCLLSRRFKEAGIAAAFLGIGFAFQRWFNLQNGGGLFSSGYEAQALSGSLWEKAAQMTANLQSYFDQILASALIPVFGSRWGADFAATFFILNLAVVVLVIIGMARSKKLDWAFIYVLIYFVGALSFWNPQVGSARARFLIPILPFLYFYFLSGIKFFAKQNKRIIFASAALIGFVLLARNLQDWRAPVRWQTTDLSVGASWIAEHAAPDAIAMVNEPAPSYPHVKRKTINFPKGDENLETYLDKQGASYILVAPLLQTPRSLTLSKNVKEAEAEMQSAPNLFTLVFTDAENNVRVYRYQK
ncbi:MAG: hypothetical protein LC099_07400 [Anaerolineales bacterium]|nr:hypothetical protein [Anaerolineales bacterium]